VVWLNMGVCEQITPLLLGGVLVSGFLLGRPGHDGINPAVLVSDLVGGNSFGAISSPLSSGHLCILPP
jgi:hypothetical protein